MDDVTRMDPDQFVKQDIAVGISVTTQVGPSNVVLTTCIERDAPVGDFHALVDKLGLVVDRLNLKREVEGLKATLENTRRNAKLSVEQGMLLEQRSQRDWQAKGKKGNWHLSPKEEADKQTHLTNVEASRASMDLLQKKIEELEAQIAKVD